VRLVLQPSKIAPFSIKSVLTGATSRRDQAGAVTPGGGDAAAVAGLISVTISSMTRHLC
jgi:formiminotetrahydrofolate cyclodeaminase